MKFTRLITGSVTAGLLGLAPVAISSPADAAVTYPTASSAEASAPAVTYGDDNLTISGAVLDSNGSSVFSGSAALQVYTAKNPVWTTIQTDDTGGSYSFFDIKPDSNSQYKVVYSGITETDGDVYLPSESAPVTVGVLRKLTIKNPRGTFLKGKVSPDYKKKKVVILRKAGKNYKKFRTLKTNKQGRFTTTLPASRKRTFFRITVPGDNNFVTTVAEGSTISY